MGHFDLLIPDYSSIQTLEFTIRLLLAGFAGAIIGLERSHRLKEAGVRTHLIICAASALMMILSKYGFSDLIVENMSDVGVKGADPSRIASQVISGVGFLGAGVIFHNNNSVKGLTTAAGMWATAGIGMTFGAGMYGLAITATIGIIIVQTLFHKYANKMDNVSTLKLSFTVVNSHEFRVILREYLESKQAEIVKSSFKIGDAGTADYELTLRMTNKITIEEINRFFDDNDSIIKASCTTVN